MLIGYDKSREGAYHLHRKKKEMYRDNLIEICSKVIEIKDKDEFLKNPRKYVIEEYKLLSGLKQVKEDEFLKLVNLPINEINRMFTQYSTFSSIDLNAPEPSFEIHIDSSEDLALFKKLEKLCKAINELEYPMGQSERIKQALNNSIELSEEAKFIPSWRYIASVKNMIF